MKRIVFWLLSTLSAVVLLFSYHTSTSSSLASGAPVVTTSGGTTGSSGSSGSSESSGPSADSGSSGSSGSSAGTGRSGTSTVTGDVAQTEWGPVQVQLSLSGGRITKVTVLQQPNDNPRDEEINSYALPVLLQETRSAQSANIDMVSGATVTSTGYVQSLQSALDKASL